MIQISMRVNELLSLTVIAIGASLTLASAQQSDRSPATVCDVLTESQKYRNKIVEISGRFSVGRHGADLLSENCEFSKPGRLAAICIKAAGSLGAPRVEFSTNPVLESVGALQRTAGDLDIGFHGSAVLEGQLFFEEERGGVGFCSTNSYPVLMVVKDIKRYCLWRDGPELKAGGDQARDQDGSAEVRPAAEPSSAIILEINPPERKSGKAEK